METEISEADHLTKDILDIDINVLSDLTQNIIPELLKMFFTERIEDPQESLLLMDKFIHVSEELLSNLDQDLIQRNFGVYLSQEKNVDPNLQISDRHNLNRDFFRSIDRDKVMTLINFNLHGVTDFYLDNYKYSTKSPYVMDFNMFVINLHKSINIIKEFLNVFKVCVKL